MFLWLASIKHRQLIAENSTKPKYVYLQTGNALFVVNTAGMRSDIYVAIRRE